ncbi:DUF4136 domain-containing protein [Rhodoferax sp. U11-2br]|uniref:DUF4136 domain-containing protein n=1 Tax=Rhodoferax sp. U11-2br TaxID=2838878 RepID=UPI001BEC86B8|nr:DUF4136 domain-containing protein [Rhodoferax sp. U11-2br]MBT3067532.1 DUF4136 domain-containing protein [Rhodoferax sp. U11-2br]
MYKALSALLFVAFLLTGCSGMRVVDSQVNSFAPATVAAGSRYRFDRLPSQQSNPAAQEQLEAMAEAALTKVGLVRDDQGASLSVQVSVTERAEQSAMDHPALGWNLGWRVGNGGVWMGRGPLFPGLDVRTSYWREVGLVLRQRSTQAVVFESRASHDGPWADSEAVLPAMLDAALQGFPTPPTGLRRVNIEIAR